MIDGLGVSIVKQNYIGAWSILFFALIHVDSLSCDYYFSIFCQHSDVFAFYIEFIQFFRYDPPWKISWDYDEVCQKFLVLFDKER